MLECHSLGFCFCYSLAFAATSLIAHSLLCRLLLVCILHVWDNWFARNSSIRQCWLAKVDSAEGSVVLNNGDTEGRELRDHLVIRHISNFPYSTIFQRLAYCGRWYLLGDITNTVVVMICNQGGCKRVVLLQIQQVVKPPVVLHNDTAAKGGRQIPATARAIPMSAVVCVLCELGVNPSYLKDRYQKVQCAVKLTMVLPSYHGA